MFLDEKGCQNKGRIVWLTGPDSKCKFMIEQHAVGL